MLGDHLNHESEMYTNTRILPVHKFITQDETSHSCRDCPGFHNMLSGIPLQEARGR